MQIELPARLTGAVGLLREAARKDTRWRAKHGLIEDRSCSRLVPEHLQEHRIRHIICDHAFVTHARAQSLRVACAQIAPRLERARVQQRIVADDVATQPRLALASIASAHRPKEGESVGVASHARVGADGHAAALNVWLKSCPTLEAFKQPERERVLIGVAARRHRASRRLNR